MNSVCRDRRNHLDFRFGGGEGGDGGGALAAMGLFDGGIVGGIGLAPPEAGDMDVGGAVWTLSPGGVGGTSGIC